MSVTTWITACDGKLRCTRRFIVRRIADGVTLASAVTVYVCLNLDTGRAARMPPEFVAAYGGAAGDRDPLRSSRG